MCQAGPSQDAEPSKSSTSAVATLEDARKMQGLLEREVTAATHGGLALQVSRHGACIISRGRCSTGRDLHPRTPSNTLAGGIPLGPSAIIRCSIYARRFGRKSVRAPF